jgi:hypothetical protein
MAFNDLYIYFNSSRTFLVSLDSIYMFLAFQLVRCYYEKTGEVEADPLQEIKYKQFTDSETNQVVYLKFVSRTVSYDDDMCVGILCGNTLTEISETSVQIIEADPDAFIRKYCQSADSSSPIINTTNPFLKYLHSTNHIAAPESSSNDITSILSLALYEVYEDISIHNFQKEVQNQPIRCVSAKSEDSSYLTFFIDSSKYFKYSKLGIYFHYGSGKKFRFVQARIHLQISLETCEDAFAMLSTLPQVRDVISKADMFENI